VNLQEMLQMVEQLIVESKEIKVPHAYVDALKDMRKVLPIIQRTRGKL
jgi:hypothetical protein